ncbi:MAG TPA: hypothetical protein VHT05_00035 [Candidatus Elarobacter sp.]|nr:hypothetical protein [Candidatus Elarobacter sp.]
MLVISVNTGVAASAEDLTACSGRTQLYATIGGLRDVSTGKTRALSVVARLFLLDGNDRVGKVYIDDAGERWVEVTTTDPGAEKRIRTSLGIAASVDFPTPLKPSVILHAPLKLGACSER